MRDMVKCPAPRCSYGEIPPGGQYGITRGCMFCGSTGWVSRWRAERRYPSAKLVPLIPRAVSNPTETEEQE